MDGWICVCIDIDMYVCIVFLLGLLDWLLFLLSQVMITQIMTSNSRRRTPPSLTVMATAPNNLVSIINGVPAAATLIITMMRIILWNPIHL